MGFGDDFKLPLPTDEAATAHCYKQLGNAVCPPVIGSVGAQILASLRKVEV